MTEQQRLWQAIQRKVGARPDGDPGIETATLVARALDVSVPVPAPSLQWPRDVESEMVSFYGQPGTRHVLLTPPYPLFFEGKRVKVITVHGRIAKAVEQALLAVRGAYTAKDITAMKLDVYDGCFSNRMKRGGSTRSVHAYAAALDFDAADNPLHADHTKALFAKPEYEEWWRAWEGVGAVSLGRARDYDFQHVQFARLA